MFNNFFKKTRPKQFMLEQTGTRVLLLPAKFVCPPLRAGEIFYADANDLNEIPGGVSEFEFWKLQF